MPDIQTSVAMPFGRAMIDIYGSKPMTILTSRGPVIFEFSERFGPLPVAKDGRTRELGNKHPFWRACSIWCAQGKVIADNNAVWHEPKKPVLEHVGGRHFLVIEPGEIGHDW